MTRKFTAGKYYDRSRMLTVQQKHSEVLEEFCYGLKIAFTIQNVDAVAKSDIVDVIYVFEHADDCRQVLNHLHELEKPEWMRKS